MYILLYIRFRRCLKSYDNTAEYRHIIVTVWPKQKAIIISSGLPPRLRPLPAHAPLVELLHPRGQRRQYRRKRTREQQ